MKKNLIMGVAAVVVLGGWYAFRPERLFVNRTVEETFETAGEMAPRAVLSGSFRTVAHDSRGIATIYEGADGTRTLRLTQFETSNGPDVRIYLVASPDAADNETVTRAGFIDLGALKGNIGDQNYAVPADLDLAQYRAVTIWCRRFGVNFGSAPLTESGADDVAAAEFTVRIENVSSASTLKLSDGSTAPVPTSPVAWALVREGNPIFTAGVAAGAGLERLAEDGDPALLASELAKTPGVVTSGTIAIPVGDTAAGPALPGKAFEFTVTARPGDRLALAFMFGQSNDWFYANAQPYDLFDANGRPLDADHTSHLTLWDAGTERNEEPGLGRNQAPRQKAPDTGVSEGGIVRPAGDDFAAPPITEVVRASVRTRPAIATRN